MKLKVCGLKYKNNIEAVAKLQPDYMGFIFYEKSSRYFVGEMPKEILFYNKVGVFVDADISYILNKVKQYNFKTIQLHGSESANYCAELRFELHLKDEQDRWQSDQWRKGEWETPNWELIKAFSIKDRFDFSVLEPYEALVDYFLFDTKGKLPGGNGYTFNWDVLNQYSSTKPYFLSGGIGLNEIDKIKKFKNNPASRYCYAIDVNSKFEIKPGLKDINALEKFKYELQH